MRADRLLAELLIMQRRGRVTAEDLARELEVSVRTIYRDWFALRVAGVPLITDAGPGGGARLYGDWRTELTGLTGPELEALTALLTIDPAGRVSKQLTTALAKLSAAIPYEQRPPVGRVHSDLQGGDGILEELSRAVHSDLAVDMEITRMFDTRIVRRVHPLGLVSHSGRWHLVWTEADERTRVDPLRSIASVNPTETHFDRPDSFDLETFWNGYVANMSSTRRTLVALLSATDDVIALLKREFGDDLRDVGRHVEVRFDSINQARASLLPWGGAVEVVGPEALRRTMIDYAEQALSRYATDRQGAESVL